MHIASDNDRFILSTHDPRRGVTVYWVGDGWSPYKDEAAMFRTRAGARRVAEGVTKPIGAASVATEIVN